MRESLHVLFSVTAPADDETRIQRFSSVLESGCNATDFADEFPENILFEKILDSYRKFRSIPHLSVLLNDIELETGHQVQTGTVDVSDASFQFWLKGFKAAKLRATLHLYGTILQEMAISGVTDDVTEIVASLSRDLAVLHNAKRPKTLLSLMDDAISKHEALRKGEVEAGVCLGFPYIDKVMGGAQRGDVVVIVGTPGCGKTYILCKSAEHAATKQGKRVLFVTMEMTGLQIGRRIAALGSGVNAMKFRLGRLDAFALDKIREYVDAWRLMDPNSFVILDDIMKMSIADISLRVQEFKPDVVYVDGLYMLKPAAASEGRRRWELVLDAVEELKQLALSEDIPIIATTQYSRKGAKDGLEGVGYSYAIAQIASVGLSIEDPDHGSKSSFDSKTCKYLRIIKGREGERGTIRLRYDMRRSTIEEDGVVDGETDSLFLDQPGYDMAGSNDGDDLIL